MTNIPHLTLEKPVKKPISLDTFLSLEESKLLDLISKSSMSEDKKFELEYIVVPSVREVVEKILQGYLGDESDLRLLGDPQILPKVMADIEQEDEWDSLGSMKRRMVVRGVKWKEEMEEGMKEFVREKMREMYSLEEWMNLRVSEKSNVKIIIGGIGNGLKMFTRANFFKTGGNPVSNDNYMESLLKEIYSPEEFERYFQGVRDKMRALYSLEEWINLSSTEKKSMKIIVGGKEKGLYILAGDSFFKTGGDPVGTDYAMQNLLKEIYSPEEFEKYYQGVRDKMRALYSLEEWMNLTHEEKGFVKIFIGGKEKGLTAFAGSGIFNTGGKPTYNHDDMRSLLKEIYSPEEFERYFQGVRDKMRALYSLEEWINLSSTEKKSMKIIVGGKEKGLYILAGDSFFKTGGDPVGTDYAMQNLLKEMYSPEEFEKYYQGVRDKMQALYSLEKWIHLTQKEKTAIKVIIGGKEKGLRTLSGDSFFKTGGDPRGRSTDFKNLMIAIYGVNEVEKYSHLLKTLSKK